MTDEFFPPTGADGTPATDGTPETTSQPASQPAMEDAFSEMEANLDGIPEGDYVTLRHEAGAPMFVALNEGETGITIKEACNRRGLRLGVVNAYVEGQIVSLDMVVPGGTIITLVGDVKGGM